MKTIWGERKLVADPWPSGMNQWYSFNSRIEIDYFFVLLFSNVHPPNGRHFLRLDAGSNTDNKCTKDTRKQMHRNLALAQPSLSFEHSNYSSLRFLSVHYAVLILFEFL